jgi:hypothetical protein
MMRSAAPGQLKLSPSLQAATFLAVLVAHLAFMTSPLHARMMGEDSHGVDMAEMAVVEGSSTLGPWPLRNGHHGHCIIEWLKIDQQMLQAMLLAVGVAAALLVPALLVSIRPPIARALAPPSTGDTQALLQVFRE